MEYLLKLIAILSPILTFVLTIIELTLALRRLLSRDRKETDLAGLLLPWMATRKYVAPRTIKHKISPAEQFRRLMPWLLGFINLVLGPVSLAISLFISTGSRTGDLLVALALFSLWLLANVLVLLGWLIARRPQRNDPPRPTPRNAAPADRRYEAVRQAPRRRSTRVTDLLPPPFEWVTITAGWVEVKEHGAFDLPAFAIAKYPITNAQYKVFVEAGDGFRNPRWWDYSRAAQAWRTDNERPQNTGFGGDDLPRTNVTWFEAVAFCRWLGAQTGEDIMLPTEQQWQRAAQGDDRREYPWGNEEPNERLCNWANNVGRPTPVTQYPKGASPYGVRDMSGNVWEWCLNEYESGNTSLDGSASRVLRGGSWDYVNSDVLRATYRDNWVPDNGGSFVGFRCARSAFG